MRKAEANDVGTLVAIGAAIAQEAHPLPIRYEGEAAAGWFASIIEQPGVVCFLEEDEDAPVGCLLGGVRRNSYAPRTLEAVCEFVWVHPKWRTTRVAIRLMGAFEWWARQQKAKDLYFSSSTGADLSMLAKIVDAVEVGKAFRKSLEAEAETQPAA